jgi:hypothetical protein
MAHGAQRVDRAEAGGAQGEGTAVVRLNTTTGEEFEQFPLCRSLHENHASARAIDRGSDPIHDLGRVFKPKCDESRLLYWFSRTSPIGHLPLVGMTTNLVLSSCWFRPTRQSPSRRSMALAENTAPDTK